MTGAPPAPEASLAGSALLRRPGLQRLLALLDGDGEATRIVGGAVRNSLMGLPVADIDLATTALPAAVMARAAAAGLRAVPTGVKHGTVTLVAAGEAFEVTTLRQDVETDGRHARVRFGRSFEDDALRRDFTINALSATPDGRVFDYVGGLDDLAARRVRFIGDATTRIREDFLRTLRFFRFHAVYGEGPLDRAGFDAALRQRAGLARLSRERIAAELMKLLPAPGAAATTALMSEAGLLGPLIGGVALPARLGGLIAIEQARGAAPDPVLRLAGLAVATQEDADRLRDALRLSNETHGRLASAAPALAALHGRRHPPDAPEINRLMLLHGRRAACDALVLAQAESAAPADDGEWAAARRTASLAPQPALPFTGADIVARGIARGPTIGAMLKLLQARWIRAGFPKEPAALARLLDEVVGDHSGPS